jgi:hypothetical protein
MSDQHLEGWRSPVTTLEGILQGRLGITEGCRTIVALRGLLHEQSNDLFTPFVGVDSETDRFPLGSVRDRWSATALAREDLERVNAENHYRSWLIDAARKLLAYANERAL